MKEGGHWPPSYFSLGTSLGPTGGVSLQPSCSENGGFLYTLKNAIQDYRNRNYRVNILVKFSTSRLCQ